MIARIRRSSLLDVAMLLAMTALVAVLVWVAVALTTNGQWRPLGPFPEQTVDATAGTVRWSSIGSPENTQNIPAVSLDGPAIVTGTKCYREAVTVTGDVRWSTVDPRGGSWLTGSGNAVRSVGCHTNTFRNEVPDVVRDYVYDTGLAEVVVIVSGCETPTSPEKGEGAALCWTSEPFALIP